MTEGRRCQVHLLDDRKLELLVQPKLLAKELLDLVASHFNLKEKEYFGIAFTDETGHLNWLQLDRRVLEHDFPKKSGPVVLYFCVRFYIESISYLKDNATIELFFLNAKSCIYKELIDVDSEVVFELASYILQEAKGDFSSNEVVRSDLKKLPALPTQALKEHPSLAYWSPTVSNCPDRSATEDAFLPFSGVLLLSPAFSDVMDSLPAHHTRVTALVSRAAGLRIPAKSLNCGATTTPEA